MADGAFAEAKRTVADARAMNPMYRVAAVWMRTPVEDLTGEQFEVVKHWAVIGLASATALATALAAVISTLPERDDKPSKLARTLRAMAAARRKTLRRLKANVEWRDRTVFRYVPVNVETGLPADEAHDAKVTPLHGAGGKSRS